MIASCVILYLFVYGFVVFGKLQKGCCLMGELWWKMELIAILNYIPEQRYSIYFISIITCLVYGIICIMSENDETLFIVAECMLTYSQQSREA